MSDLISRAELLIDVCSLPRYLTGGKGTRVSKYGLLDPHQTVEAIKSVPTIDAAPMTEFIAQRDELAAIGAERDALKLIAREIATECKMPCIGCRWNTNSCVCRPECSGCGPGKSSHYELSPGLIERARAALEGGQG